MNPAPKRQPIPFGKYLLLDRVNIGGMAEVWRAKTFGAGGFERVLAIKRILPNIAEDAEFISMFIDEAKITVQLNHANIAQIYELSHIASSYYIAMEYVSGKDLRAVFDRCRKRGEPAPISLTSYAIAQCCEGLDYAHRAKDKLGGDMNIVHRDVSPQNVLVSFDGEVKVIDFGIAKAAGKATKTQAGILKGKFGYMSPEQIRGLPLDRRSDIFAIGICLYELLTGERLFVGDTDFSVLEKVRKVEVLPPSHFNRRIPAELERIVMKALARDVDDRYQFASELAEELRTFMYSTGNAFARKDLSAFMRATFAEDFEKEKVRLQEYVELKAPEGMLAAAEAGYSGAFPTGPLPLLTPSATTAPPTGGPTGRLVVSAGTDGLPPMTRAVPPTIGPASLQALGPVETAPTMAPRLSAAPPSNQVEREEHQATIIEGLSQETRAGPARSVSAEERLQASRSPMDLSDGGASDPVAEAWLGGGEPSSQLRAVTTSPPRAPPRRNTGPRRSGRLASASEPLGGSGPLPTPLANRSPVSQDLEAPGNARLVIALAGIVALLVIGVAAAVLLRPPVTGLVIIDVPADVRSHVELQINGEPVTEKGGAPLKDWPQVRTVKVGKVTVRLAAPGYEPLFEIVEVKESEPAELKREMKKSSR